jgi:hypothetical protein
MEQTTTGLQALGSANELSIDSYNGGLDFRIFVPDPGQPRRARVQASLEHPWLRSRALDADAFIQQLGFRVKVRANGAVRVRTHVSLTRDHEIEDLVFRLLFILWKVFDAHPRSVNVRWVKR